jgi:predicted transcriptional regulator
MADPISRRQRGAMAREREKRAWTLYTEHGYTQARIATELHVSQQAVAKMIARAEAMVADDLRGKVERERSRQHVQLDAIRRMALEAYQESKGDHTVKTQTRKEAGSDSEATTKIQVVQKAGDPRFLGEARGAMADLRKLHGLDAPTKIASMNMNMTGQLQTAAEYARMLRDEFGCPEDQVERCVEVARQQGALLPETTEDR